MPGSERRRELRRRRKRREQVTKIKKKVPNATRTEREALAVKLRNMTPGAAEIIKALDL
ncbi:MAG: DUF6800 family protein [Planctomycetota bacterium]